MREKKFYNIGSWQRGPADGPVFVGVFRFRREDHLVRRQSVSEVNVRLGGRFRCRRRRSCCGGCSGRRCSCSCRRCRRRRRRRFGNVVAEIVFEDVFVDASVDGL